jgi:hypothetical protein
VSRQSPTFVSLLNFNQRPANPNDNDTSRGVTGLWRQRPERDKRLWPVVFRGSRRGTDIFVSGAPREGRGTGHDSAIAGENRVARRRLQPDVIALRAILAVIARV